MLVIWLPYKCLVIRSLYKDENMVEEPFCNAEKTYIKKNGKKYKMNENSFIKFPFSNPSKYQLLEMVKKERSFH